MRQKLLLLIFLLTALISSISAQTNNPANIILTGTGRYSLKLSDYVTSSPSMLTMTVSVSDITISNMPVKFMLTISNANYKFTTKLSNVRPITIHGGQTYVLYCSDLAEYFNPNNINFNGYKYQSIGQLPEGNNKLQVYLINQITGKRISNIASLNMYATLASAPALRKPANNSTFESTSQNPTINFEWKQPSNSYSINTKYKFQLFEIQNDNISLNTIADGINPFYESEVNNTPYFNLNTALLNLKIGQKYAWRVIASDVNEIQKFKNDGKSEIFTFQYLTPPIPVNGLSVKVVNRNMNFSWEANQNQSSFDVEYYDYQTERTISGNIPENRIQLSAPKSDYKIKFRVRAICYGDEKRKSDWTPWLDAKVAPAPKRDTNFVCGKVFPDREITNLELKTVFQEGEILESKNGDTRYEMVGVWDNNGGVLSGQFYMIMDCWGGAKILCDFTDTKINTDNIVLTTRFSNHPFPDYVVEPEEIANYVKDLWLNGNSLATSTKIRDTIVIKEKFDYLYANENGKIMAVSVNPDGSVTESVVDFYKSPTQCLVTDGKGDSLIVTNDNKIMGISEYRATGGNKALLNEYHRKKDSAAVWYVNFDKYDDQKFGFDKYETNKNKSLYPYLISDYDLRYKSIATSSSDKVKVTNFNKKDSIIFKDKYGVRLKLSDNNILNFSSQSSADTNYIYAYKDTIPVGKLMLNTYAKKTYDVVLVSVNGAKFPNANEIKDYLDKVYHVANVEFNVLTDTLTISDLENFTHGGSGTFTVYNDSQKKVLEAYDKNIKDKIQYLFFIENVTETEGVGGYNPLGYQCGFIYNGANNRTIAHEIGHGLFSLHHPFADSKQAGKTDNLMDYSFEEDIELYHYQWDSIQEIQRKWLKWRQDESEGESVFNDGFYYVSVSTNKNLRIFNQSYITIFEGTHFTLSVVPIKERFIRRVQNSIKDLDGWNLYSLDSVTFSSNDVVWRDSLNQNVSVDNVCLSLGSHLFSVEIKNITVHLKLVSGNKIIKKSKEYNNGFDTIRFCINVMDNPYVSLIPADIDNYYTKFGFDDAQIEECRKAGDYSQCMINGKDYYIPWLTLQPNVLADLKMDLNLSEEMFVSHRLQTKLLLGDSSRSTFVSDTALYFVIKPNDSTKLPIKINGLDSLIVRLSEIDGTILVSSESVGTGFLDIYTVLNGCRNLSGRIEIECRELRTIGELQLVSVNNYPIGEVAPRLDLVNSYLVQAGVCFVLASPNVISIDVDLSSCRDYLETFMQRIILGGYKDGPTYIFFNSYGYDGVNRGNSYLPQKSNKSGWVEIKSDDSIVLVHELIHTMGLNHVFDYCKSVGYNNLNLLFTQKRNIPKYSTNNIMDYSKEIIDTRRLLMKYQINHIYNIFANRSKSIDK